MSDTIRQILVHLDPTPTAIRRLTAARRIAQWEGADVAALYAVLPGLLAVPYPELGPSAAAALADIDRKRRSEVRQAFEQELASAAGSTATWGETEAVPMAAAFAQQALHADLMVLGQPDVRDVAVGSVARDFIPDVLAASGRPALVLPYIGPADRFGEVVAIAWKATPQAARAVQAALPLLKRARQLHVFTWGAEPAPAITGRALDLRQYLQSHGLEASWHQQRNEPNDLGEQLLSRVADVGADLLVMGCYGHSRTREWVLGGVSRTLLQSMTLPVLMAH